MFKKESSEDIGKQELEEGKTSLVSDFLTKSPNIQKKRTDFGHGTLHEYTWFYNNNADSDERKPILLEKLHSLDARISKAVDKWDRVFLLDSKYRNE